MRRLLTEPYAYLRGLTVSATEGWDAFFFSRAEPTAVGLIRLVVGALLFWDLAVLGLDLRDFLGDEGWIGSAAARQYAWEYTPGAWSLWFWIPDGWLYPAWAVALAVYALFAVGYKTRLTAPLAWVVAVSTVRRAPAALFGFDQMIATWTFYLAVFGAAGQAVSIDRFLARHRARGRRGRPGDTADIAAPTVEANLTLRVIQVHLAVVYGSSGLSKLMGPEWWNGTALEMILLTPEFRRFDLSALAAYPKLLNLLTHGGVALELVYPVLIWVRKLRPLVIASMVLMHLGIDALLGLTEFGLAMIAANLAFTSGPWLRSWVASATPSAPPHRRAETRTPVRAA